MTLHNIQPEQSEAQPVSKDQQMLALFDAYIDAGREVSKVFAKAAYYAHDGIEVDVTLQSDAYLAAHSALLDFIHECRVRL